MQRRFHTTRGEDFAERAANGGCENWRVEATVLSSTRRSAEWRVHTCRELGMPVTLVAWRKVASAVATQGWKSS